MMKRLEKMAAKITLSEVPTAVLFFGLAVIVTSIMGQVLGDVQDTQTVNTAESNITQEGLDGTTNLANNYSLIGTIIGLVIVVGVLISGFSGMLRR